MEAGGFIVDATREMRRKAFQDLYSQPTFFYTSNSHADMLALTAAPKSRSPLFPAGGRCLYAVKTSIAVRLLAMSSMIGPSTMAWSET